MQKKTDLLKRLRETRSTGKSFVIERWLSIHEALESGYTKKAIFELLVQDGLSISYTQFAHLTKQLIERTSHETKEAVTRNQEPKKDSTVPDKPGQAKDKEPAELADGTTKEPIKPQSGKSRRFEHSPIPNKKELY